MFQVVILSILLFGLFSTTNANECQTPDNKNGTCIPIRQCRYIIDMMTTETLTPELKAKLRRYHCGFQDSTPLVCCPNQDIQSHRNIDLINSLDCGPYNEDKILNGPLVRPFDLPYNVLIAYNTERGKKYLCGGTVINDNYILTSAYCTKDLTEKYKIAEVRLGELDLSKEIDCDYSNNFEDCAPEVQDIEVSEYLSHPDYNSKTLDNNIGLVRLSKHAIFQNESVQSICLPTDSESDKVLKNPEPRRLLVAGWGLDNFVNHTSELFRQEYHIPPLEECRKNYTKITPKIEIGDNQFCLQEYDYIKKSYYRCVGESGDPVSSIVLHQGWPHKTLFGIMSTASKFCGNIDQPKVITKVAPYMQWILDNIRP